jgi:hypothetical protein
MKFGDPTRDADLRVRTEQGGSHVFPTPLMTSFPPEMGDLARGAERMTPRSRTYSNPEMIIFCWLS